MKQILLLCIFVSSVLFNQISNAQIPKEKAVQIDTLSKKASQKEEINFNSFAGNIIPIVTNKKNGIINWTAQYIEASGSQIIDTVKFKNKAQAKSMATRSAVVVAQHNIFEIIKDIKVTGKTTVAEMLTKGNNIYPIIDGVAKRAEIIGEAIVKNGMIEVKVRVQLYQEKGLASALYDKIPQNQIATTQAQLAKGVQDQVLVGLAFDLNSKNFDPSLFPLIVDKKDNVIFDFSKIYDPIKGDFPKFFKTTEDLFKKIGYAKGIERLNVSHTESGKIVLDDKNIKKINWNKIIQNEGSISNFLILFF